MNLARELLVSLSVISSAMNGERGMLERRDIKVSLGIQGKYVDE